MRRLAFVDCDAINAHTCCADFLTAHLVVTASGIQCLDILLCYVVMSVLCRCIGGPLDYLGFEDLALTLHVVHGAV